MSISLSSIDFRRPLAAREIVDSIAARLKRRDRSVLANLLHQVPDPDAALDGLARYLNTGSYACSVFELGANRLPAALTLFSHGRYLTDTLVRYPELLEWALKPEQAYHLFSADEMRSELGWLNPSLDDDEAAGNLARFKRAQMLRISLRDLLGFATLAESTIELSNLADAMLQGAHDHIRENLLRQFGRPLCLADSGPIECHFVIVALGKHGGRELNYSSDIDLMYLFTGDGETSGPIRISNREFMIMLARRLTKMLSRLTPDGFSYRVDLRLRPEGSMGELVISLNGAAGYYHDRARDWELQMLIKARPVAGDVRLGETFLRMIAPLIYRTTTDFSTIEKVAESRDRISKKLDGRRHDGLDVKLAPGGIRDIEFLVQCLQRLYGGQDPWVRSGGTLFALQRLWEKGYLAAPDYSRLSAAYQYLRTAEHRLQIAENRQTHQLPTGERELTALARKMRGPGRADLERDFDRHLRSVREIYDRVIRSQPAAAPAVEMLPPAPVADEAAESRQPPAHAWRAQLIHMRRKAPRAAAQLNGLELTRGGELLEHFLNRLVSKPELLAELDRSPELVPCLGDVIEHSPYLAKYLISFPAEFRELRERPDGLASPAGPLLTSVQGIDNAADRRSELRRAYRARMLHILAASICRSQPIFPTLAATSDLADQAIQAAYALAAREVFGDDGPPRDDLHVIALGRLGMREFDHASDADLVFVIPDAQRDERERWSHVVERLIDIISSYTREGTLFAVDPRLRPMGREGELVQSESYFKKYFEERAEAWEALTYMKARAVAGCSEAATRFLTELQWIGWKRFGLDTESGKLLRAMRERLDQEQGRDKPIKAGPGGYYDIDFILLYLRLREAAVFFDVLNTPQRIDVLRGTGALDPQQADRLLRAAVFYRALDHAVRVSTGNSSSSLPASRSQQQNLADLIRRWCDFYQPEEPLGPYLQEVRKTTREMFLDIFP